MPWLRVQLAECLLQLSDRDWQEERWGRGDPGASGLDELLDFFDDSGVLDEPRGRLGFVLADEREVAEMAALNAAIDRAISMGASSDAKLIRSQAWSDVVVAARRALVVVNSESAGE